MSEILEIDPALIDPDPLNQSRDVTDEFIASIREDGILMPLLVSYDPETGRYPMIAGHRRHVAAQRLALPAVPVIVREELDGDAARLQLVENLFRTDLRPTQEGKAVARLTKTHKPPELAAKLGKSTEWIRTRITLSKLDADAAAAVDSGIIPVASITQFAKLEPARRKRVLATPGNIDYAMKNEIAAQNRDGEVKKLRASITAPFDAKLGYSETLAYLGIDPADHATEPCHAYKIESYGPINPIWGCTNPERHLPDGESEIRSNRTAVGTRPAPDDEAIERRKAATAEFDQRLNGFIQSQIAGRLKPADLEIVWDVVLAWCDEEAYEDAMSLLGEDPAAELTLIKFSQKSAANRMKAALAAALAVCRNMSYDPDMFGPANRWLEARGWTEGLEYQPVVDVAAPALNDPPEDDRPPVPEWSDEDAAAAAALVDDVSID